MPEPAHSAPNTNRRNTSAKANSMPSAARLKPTMLSRRSGVVVMQVSRSNIRLIRRIALYLDSPCSRSA